MGSLHVPKFQTDPQVIRQLLRQILHKSFYTRYQVLFYLWRIQPSLKRCKAPKHYGQHCLKIFFLLSKLSMMIQLPEKSPNFCSKIKVLRKNYQLPKLKAF